jgi:hypothetical protein
MGVDFFFKTFTSQACSLECSHVQSENNSDLTRGRASKKGEGVGGVGWEGGVEAIARQIHVCKFIFLDMA